MKTSMFGKSALAAALALALVSGASAEVIDLTGYSGSTAITTNSNNIASWTLANAAVFGDSSSEREVFLSAQFSLAPNTSIGSGEFIGVWLGNMNGPGFGIRGAQSAYNTSDVFVRPQYSDMPELAQNGIGSIDLAAGQSFTMLVSFYKDGASSVFNGVKAWFNPTAADTASSFDYSFVRSTGSAYIPSFSSIGLRSVGLNTAAGESVTVSGLTVGTTFADVSPVPEPATTTMLLAGLGMMGIIARRRIRA